MPELKQRGKYEAELADALASAHEDARHQILDKLGDPPNEHHLDAPLWAALAVLYKDALMPVLEDVYIAAADALGDELDVAIDVERDAHSWAASYAAQLAALLVQNRKDFVSDTLQKAKDKDWTPEQFETALLVYFSASNAAAIAVTEITNAVSEGEQGYVRHYSISFPALVALLLPVVRNDFDPCDICIDKVDHSAALVGFPPYHKSCRCYVDYLISEE